MKFREVLKSKIDQCVITKTELYYGGSIGIDKALLVTADIVSGEKVQVLNYNNGYRIETYVIEEKEDSGTIALYGPAARCGLIGDKICILSYSLIDNDELLKLPPPIILVDETNRIIK